MRSALTLALALCAAGIVSVLVGCKGGDDSGVTDTHVKLGLFVSTSGQVQTYGQDTKNGVDLAVEEINKAGGINGKQIEIVFANTNSKADEARQAASQLATKDKVFLAMGAVSSGLSLAAAPVFQEAGIPMISPSSTNPEVTKKGDLIFRICFLDDFQGGACAQFATKDVSAKRAAILFNQSNDYSKGLAQFFKKKFIELGGEIVNEQSFKEGDTNFDTQISSIAGQNPDVIFLPCYYGNVGLVARAIRQVKELETVPLLGGDGWESGELVKTAGDALEGCYFGNHYSQEDPRELVQNFVSAYKDKYGVTPTSLAALGYDLVYVVKKAIESAGKYDRQAVAEALRKLKDFEAVTGTFSIDENRNARKPISILRIEGTKFLPHKQIKPEDVE